jgi:CheY-like chemotaxis protein
VLGGNFFDLAPRPHAPEVDGLSVLRRLRKRSATLPVLILSAKGREEEKVKGFGRAPTTTREAAN